MFRRPNPQTPDLPHAQRAPTSGRPDSAPRLRRRELLSLGAGAVGALLPVALIPKRSAAQAIRQCTPGQREALPLTPPNIEGPFYRAGAPETTVLDAEGRIQIGGRVLDTHCRPVRNGVLEVWHANSDGEYDAQGYRYRAVIRCNGEGQYSFRTAHPGYYRAGGIVRPAHIHVKVYGDGRPTLTTQLYFQGDSYQDSDPWFRQSLVLYSPPLGCGWQDPAAPRQMGFEFVV